MDIIVTVCASAAGETCPVWPRRTDHSPITVHWGADDPAYIEPLSARQKAFSDVYDLCHKRISALLNLSEAQLSDKDCLQAIGELI